MPKELNIFDIEEIVKGAGNSTADVTMPRDVFDALVAGCKIHNGMYTTLGFPYKLSEAVKPVSVIAPNTAS